MKQDINTISNLLSKYYNGLSSENDEKALRKYFRGKDIPEEFDADRRLFVALDKSTNAPGWLKENICRNIDSKTAAAKNHRHWFISLTAAATFAIALTAGFSLLRSPAHSKSEMSPEEIRQMTAMALNKLASTVKKGCNAVETAETKTIQTTRIILDSINSI